ncbi:hypothetical protein [Kitasatospora humi]|nr:hypothetical protein [Kitasatospora humi]
MRDGVVLFSRVGALPEGAPEEVIRRILAIDMAEVHRRIAAEAA